MDRVMKVGKGGSWSRTEGVGGMGTGTCSIFFSFLAGPLSTGLSHYYSSRRLIALGIMISTVGLFLCAFCSNLLWFYFCFGVLGGTGSSLGGHQGILLCQQYFRKRRVTANGISMVGVSLAFMIFPPLIAYMMEVYAAEGTFILWSGILLHGMVGAALCHPVSWHLKLAKTALVHPGKDVKEDDVLQVGVSSSQISLWKEKDEMSHDGRKSKERPDSEENDRESNCSEASDSIEDNSDKIPKAIKETNANSYHETKNTIYDEEKKQLTVPDENNYRTETHLGHRSDPKERIRRLTNAYEDLGSTLCIEVQMQKEDFKISSNSNDSLEKEEEDGPYIICGLKLPRITKLFQLNVLKHPAFLITTLGSVANRTVYVSSITYMPSVGHEAGVGALAPYFLTIIAMCELVAKIIISVVSDQGWLQRRYIYILACSTAGLANISVTFGWNFATLGTSCGLMGFSYGTIMSIGPVLLVEYLGMKLLPCSYGLLLFANGIAGLMFMPFTGWLADVLGNYTTAFYMLGSINMVPAVLWLIMPYFHTHDEDQEKCRSNSH